ncbi:MAG: ribose 5-phosphate isomerase B [candidate division Zixibacteria bacterium]|nr:ribose 5-phosphate isomerase B [candidate division Zixibacteria bacterium]
MKIAIGSDHAGYELKEKVKSILESWGHEVADFGTHSTESVDYSDYAIKVAESVANNTVERGVAICWTGNGVTVTANKIAGIRATIALNADMAYLARAHNNSNVLTLASKYVKDNEVEDIIKLWLETEFEGGRHLRRLAKIPNSGMKE